MVTILKGEKGSDWVKAERLDSNLGTNKTAADMKLVLPLIIPWTCAINSFSFSISG